MAQRPEGKEHAGLWEFPGGKFELNENLGEALAREIHEELGLSVLEHEELMQIQHQYDDYFVSLKVALVTKFSGTERGMEGQKIAWVAPSDLSNFDFPEANKAILQKLGELNF